MSDNQTKNDKINFRTTSEIKERFKSIAKGKERKPGDLLHLLLKFMVENPESIDIMLKKS